MHVDGVESSAVVDHHIIARRTAVGCRCYRSIRRRDNVRSRRCSDINSLMVRRRSRHRGYSRSIIAGHPCAARARPPERSSGIRMFLHPGCRFLRFRSLDRRNQFFLRLNLRRIIVGVALRIFNISRDVRKLRLLLPHHSGNSRFIALDRRLECLQIGILLLQLGFQIHNRLHGVLVLGKLLSVIALYLCDIICGI